MRLLTKLFCKWLGWHTAIDIYIVESLMDFKYFKATCARCGKSLLKDSQGNWF